MKRILYSAAAMILGCMLIFGCGSHEVPENVPEETSAAVPETTEPADAPTLPIVTAPSMDEPAETTAAADVIPEGYMRSIMTGELVPVEIGTRRPIGFQIDNEKKAQPQRGVAQAEVVYEVPIEAYEVRLTAFFQDWDDVGSVGPLRSARKYHPMIASEFDAIFFHNGHSDLALPYLNDPRCDDLEGIENSGWPCIFQRDDHMNGHNDFTNFEKVTNRISQLGFRETLSEDFTYKFRFAADDAPVTLDEGQTADVIYTNFKQNHSYFVWDADSQKYFRYAYDEQHVDQDNGEPVAVENVIIQYCGFDLEWDKDTKSIHVCGSDKGWFFTNGKGIPITWEKSDIWENTHYYDEAGEEIVLNQGKTWVAIVLPSLTGEITIE